MDTNVIQEIQKERDSAFKYIKNTMKYSENICQNCKYFSAEDYSSGGINDKTNTCNKNPTIELPISKTGHCLSFQQK